MKEKIGVIADTITDTEMGGIFFESQGYEVIMCPVKEDSVQCSQFFQRKENERAAYITKLIKQIKRHEIKSIVFYANSICGYVDVEKLCAENDVGAITPLQAYKRLGKAYKKPCVWAATIGALEGIEKSLQEGNSAVEVCGTYNLSAAIDIENGLSPKEVIQKNGLTELADFAEKAGCDCIILGCTHFPYLMSELSTIAEIPIIDPADIMLEILEARSVE
ncbi:MAG: aspartate/glutamate racemase family protein [Lachnospiraceae bacterium]|nr:aspartate/glutamate racemase family protein [Lachnospiraceae bacterium]